MGAKGAPKTGGRRPGSRNKVDIQREEKLRAELAKALQKAKRAGIEPRVAIDDLYRLTNLATGVAAHYQPKQSTTGELIINDADVAQFGDWWDRLFQCAELLLKYQLPQMKAVDMPAPPPEPGDPSLTKRFTLRVFEGGRAVRPIEGSDDDEQG